MRAPRRRPPAAAGGAPAFFIEFRFTRRASDPPSRRASYVVHPPRVTRRPAGGMAQRAGTDKMPPNIVVAFADDWGRYASAYASHGTGPSADVNSLLSTPHFDRVAAEGALFLNVRTDEQ